MTKTVSLICLAAVLALSACSKSSEEPATQPSGGQEAEASAASSSPSVEASEAALPSDASSEMAPATPSSAPMPTGTVVANEIPPALRGRWGLVPKDCTSKLGDAKGLMTITAGQLKFYESVAKLNKVKEAEPSHIRATFAYSGEGMTWTQDVVLDAKDGGKTLIRRDYGKDAQPGPLTYTRCS